MTYLIKAPGNGMYWGMDERLGRDGWVTKEQNATRFRSVDEALPFVSFGSGIGVKKDWIVCHPETCSQIAEVCCTPP